MEAEKFDFVAHLARQAAWSKETFGPGPRTEGVSDHIRKELLEIAADPTDLKEWIDVVILALDGAWRCGGSPEQIIAGIVAKQAKNEGRNWPDWRTADPTKAIEHDRSGEPAAAPQVVADERAAFEAWCKSNGFNTQRFEDQSGIHYELNGTRAYWVGWDARAALTDAPVQASSDLAKSILSIPCSYTLDHASGNRYDHQGHLEGFASALKEAAKLVGAAPVQAQEPFAYMIVDDNGEAYFGEFCVSSGKTDLEAELEGLNFGQDDEPYKIVPVFRAPVQPVAVPDATIVLSGHQLRMALDLINPGGPDERDELDDQLLFCIRQHRYDEGKVSTGMCCWNGDTDGVLPLDGEYEAAAPAAQGDAKDAERAEKAEAELAQVNQWYRTAHQISEDLAARVLKAEDRIEELETEIKVLHQG